MFIECSKNHNIDKMQGLLSRAGISARPRDRWTEAHSIFLSITMEVPNYINNSWVYKKPYMHFSNRPSFTQNANVYFLTAK